MLELAIPKPFSGLDESKTDKPTLAPVLGCFHGLDESKRAEKTLELAIRRDKSKIVTNTLELVLSRTIQTRVEIKSIQDLNRQQSVKEA
jgi:hypothetical protein